MATLEVNQNSNRNFMSESIHSSDDESSQKKCLTVADDSTNQCVDIATDFGMGEAYVTRLPNRETTI